MIDLVEYSPVSATKATLARQGVAGNSRSISAWNYWQFSKSSSKAMQGRMTEAFRTGFMKKKLLNTLVLASSILLYGGMGHAQSAFFQAVTNLSPAAYWPLQETVPPPVSDVETNYGALGAAANAYYSSTNLVRGLQGAIASDADTSVNFRSAVNGSFLAVPLTDSRVSLPVGPFSVEVWIFPTNGNACTVMAQTGVAGTGGLNNGANSAGWSLNQNFTPSNNGGNFTGWSFHVYNGAGSTGGAESSVIVAPITLNTWYHVVCVFDGVNVTIYINGDLTTYGQFQIAMTGSYVRDLWSPLTIGCGRGLNNNRFGGSLDEISIYTNALSATQVANHYNAGVNGSGTYSATVLADNPYMYWRLNAPIVSTPALGAYPPAGTFGSISAGGLYLQGTTPGVAGPPFGGFGSPSYACAFNGLGTDATNGIPYSTNGTASPFVTATGSGIVITNVDSALNQTSNNITAMVWFKSNPEDGRFQSLIGHGDSSWRFSLDGTTGKLRWNPGEGGELTSVRTYNDGKWHFVAGVYTNAGTIATGTNYLYVDGVLDTSGSVTTAATGSTTNIMIGGAPEYSLSGNNGVYRPQRHFAGSLAHAAYLTNALDPATIQNLYDAAQVPPAILAQPAASPNALAGATNVFNPVVSGSNPKTIRWFYNSANSFSGAVALNDGTDANGSFILGVTNTSLVISNLKVADSGYYFVTVTNNYGAVTSILSHLTVNPDPLITAQNPTGAFNLFVNQNFTLSVTASGLGALAYQWYTNGVADTATGTASTYALTSVQLAISGTTYKCVVTDTANSGTATSALATLTVIAPPADPYASTILALNPDGYWPMHEVAPPAPGNIETNLGTLGVLANGYYADWTGSSSAITRRVPGALAGSSDPAVFFNQPPDGNSPGYLLIPHTAPSTSIKPPFTFEAWVKPLSSGFGDIVSQSAFGPNSGAGSIRYGVRLCWGSGATGGSAQQTFSVFVGNGTTTANNSFATVPFPVAQWYHVVLTYDATNWILYVNDNPFVTQTSTAFPMGIDVSDPICVGQGLWGNTGPQRAFPGIIDEVAIYTNALSLNDVQNHYTAGTSASPNPTYDQAVQANHPTVYLRMNAPAYAAPPISSWPVVTNYGKVAANGVYTPGSIPGLIPGPSAGGIPVANLTGPNAMPGNGMSSFADVGQNAAFNPTTNAFSYSAWFKGNPGDIRSFQTIVGHSDNSFRAALNSNGKLQVHGAGVSASDITSSQVYNDGNWHQFVLTFTGTNSSILLPGTNTLYVDGVQVGTSVSVGNPGTNLSLLIGSDPQYTNNPAGPGRTFAGSVCEVAFWNNLALSSNQVISLWNAAGVPAFITGQPISASLNQGVAFTNTVAAGGSAPLAYRWFYNAVSNYSGATAVNNTLDGRILGATSVSLVFTNVLGSDAGFYFAVVTNNYASVTSSIVSLSVFTKPIIGGQFPIPYTNLFTLFAGANPSFSLTSISGAAPLAFQWFTNGVKDPFGTNATYQLHNVQPGGITNFCIVGNFVGSATSMVWTATVIPAPAAPYPQSTLSLGPIAYLRLNEADNGLANGNPGAIVHDYVGGNDGIYTNVTLGQSGYAQGLATQNNYSPPTEIGFTAAQFGSFPPIDNYAGQIAGLDFAGPANSSHPFSIGVWVNAMQVLPNGAGIVTKGYGNGGEQFDLDIFGNTFRFFVRDAAGTVHGPTSTFHTDGNWHHLVGVCDQPNGSVSLYVDGLLAGQTSIPVNAGILSSTNLISIGARRSGVNTNNYDFQFQSYINDVAFYNYALSAALVQSNYLAAGVPPYIAVQPPAFATVSEGGTLTISASVIGTAPLAYQWFDNVNSPMFVGQTNATLTLSNVPVSLNGDGIFLTTTNIYGSTNTSFVFLTVNSGPPTLTASNLPPQVLLPIGKSYTYSVEAGGTLPLSYQWYAGAIPIAGATASSFTVNGGALGSTNFSVVITNIHGSLTASSLLTIIPMPTDQYSTNILALHPVGYWPLQETAAAAPVTMETNYGVLGELGTAYYAINTASQPRIGFGSAGALTGDSDTAVSFSGPSGTNYAFVPRVTPALTMKPPLTFEVWVNSSSTAFSDLISQSGNGLNSPSGGGNWGGVRLSYGGNNAGGPNIQFYVANGNGTTRNNVATAANSLPFGTWHHCVATYDGTNTMLYVDGALLMNSTALSGANTEAIDTWSPLTIGDGLWQGGGTGPTRSFTGTLDEVAIYTNILSGSQVSDHFAAGTINGNYKQTVLDDNPLLYYRMDLPGFVNPDSATYPSAVNYGSAPVNGVYPGGIVPGGIAGPQIAGLGTNVAAPGNGIVSCVDAGNDPTFNPTGQQPFSTLLWFKGYPGDSRVQTLMSHGTTNWAMNLDGTTGRIVWNLFNGGQVTSTNILNDGNWHNVVGVFNGTTSSLYVDGVINSSGAAAALAGEPNADLFLGGNPDFTAIGVNQRYLAGGLAQVALFTNALTSAQISNLYNLAVVVATPTISLTRIGNSLIISYTGTLLSSANAQGPYTPVAGATSPYTVPLTDAQHFYRARNP
jgi:hypothetical protein